MDQPAAVPLLGMKLPREVALRSRCDAAAVVMRGFPLQCKAKGQVKAMYPEK